MIYFAQVGSTVKIGCSHRSIKNRISSLRAATHEHVELLASCIGSFDLEREFHQKFAEEHISKEWFRLSKRIIDECRDIGISTEVADDGPSTRIPHSQKISVEVSFNRSEYNVLSRKAAKNNRTVPGEICSLIADGIKYRSLPKRSLKALEDGAIRKHTPSKANLPTPGDK